MLPRRIQIQLLVFAVVAVVSVVYVGGRYAGLDRLFGSQGYVVSAQLADSGGIFVNAEVTYRGVAVGSVREMHLTDDGVQVDLDLEEGGPKIPADTTAVVANRSAVGEQYVDLRPNHEQGPYLENGSVIDTPKTAIPIAPETVLSNLDSLASSVNPKSLQTVVDESYDAFADAGPELQKLLDSTGSLTATAMDNIGPTKSLLANGQVVLDTQQRQSENITSLASNLHSISAQLKESDPDLRKVIDEAPGLSREVSDLLARSGTDLGVVMANSLTTAQITTARTDAIEEALVALPVISAFSRSANSNGEGHLALVLDFFDPHSCTKGYEGTRQRPANDLSEAPANEDAYCAEVPGSPTGVRGAQNAPMADKPVDVPARPQEQKNANGQQGLPGVLDLSGLAPETSGLGKLLGLAG